jgi:DNA-binding transcriptional LysR family regulator
MTLEQLRLFVAVAERAHVTRAAEAMNLTQSAVSAAILALERRYGVPLFHRVGRHVELTAEGRTFLVEARALVAQAEAAERTLKELSGLKRGTLSMMASQTICSYWLPQRLVDFRNRYPRIDVRVEVGNTKQVADAVANGSVEIGLVEGAVNDALFNQAVVGRDRLVIVAPRGHSWVKKPPRTAADLLKENWVLREPGSGTRSEFEAALKKKGIDPSRLRTVLELPSNEAVRTAVKAGAGVTAISELVGEAGIQFGAVSMIKFALPDRPFHALWHKERYQTKAGAAFLAVATAQPTNG